MLPHHCKKNPQTPSNQLEGKFDMNDKRQRRNKSLDCVPASRFDNLVRNCGKKAQGAAT
jgi:hypothetical protein